MPVIANSSLIIFIWKKFVYPGFVPQKNKTNSRFSYTFSIVDRSREQRGRKQFFSPFHLHWEREREGERRWCRRIRIRIGWRWRRRREAQTTWKCIRRGKYRFSIIPIFSESPLLLALVDSSSATIQVLTPLSLPLFPLICLRALKFLIAFF